MKNKLAGKTIENVLVHSGPFGTYIDVTDENEIHYKIQLKELIKIFRQCNFSIEKKRLHNWIECEVTEE